MIISLTHVVIKTEISALLKTSLLSICFNNPIIWLSHHERCRSGDGGGLFKTQRTSYDIL
jgi:hypothetical protein